MNKIKFYYGLSGCLKGTTIGVKEKGTPTMNSAIKNWKYYQDGLFEGQMQYDDLVYSILHFVRLGEFIKTNTGQDMIVERGVTDSLFYRTWNDEYDRKEEDPNLIKKAVGEELKLIPENYVVEKVLLIQKDMNFLTNRVMKDPYRNKTFKGSPELYMELQEKYVQHTKTYNQIDQVIVIENAEDYIKNILGIDYKQN